MAKKRIYSLKPIRGNYTYSVYEIADMYNITPDTVFRWIRNEGLKRNGNSRQYFIHSSDLNFFLEKRNKKHKHPCKDGEMFCMKCQKNRMPKTGTLKNKKMPNKSILAMGKCPICNRGMNLFVSSKKWAKTHPLYPRYSELTKQHNVEHESHRECQTRMGEQLCLNMTQ